MKNRVYQNLDSDGARHCNETCSQAVFHKGNKLYDYLVALENRVKALEQGGSSTPTGSATDYTDKLFTISGDSISTYKDISTGKNSHYAADGSASYITADGQRLETYRNTWWMKLIDGVNAKLCTNASCGGASVSATKDDESIWEGFDLTGKCGCSPERIAKLKSTTTNTYYTAGDPDYIICFFGANDWAVNASMGDYDGSSPLQYPAETERQTTFSVGIGIMVDRIKTAYPNARIVLCSMYNYKFTFSDTTTDRSTPAQTVAINKSRELINGNYINYTIQDFNDRTKLIAQNLGLGFIDFYNAWTFADRLKYVPDDLHPNKDGMEKLGQIAVNAMKAMTFV